MRTREEMANSWTKVENVGTRRGCQAAACRRLQVGGEDARSMLVSESYKVSIELFIIFMTKSLAPMLYNIKYEETSWSRDPPGMSHLIERGHQ